MQHHRKQMATPMQITLRRQWLELVAGELLFVAVCLAIGIGLLGLW